MSDMDLSLEQRKKPDEMKRLAAEESHELLGES